MIIACTILLLVLAFFAWTVWRFLKYKRQESGDKRKVGYYLSTGASLAEAIELAFSDLNRTANYGLRSDTIHAIAHKLASFSGIMDPSNVVELYSSFVERYVFLRGRVAVVRDVPSKKSLKLDEARLLYAVEHLDLVERNGYYYFKPSTEEDFKTKYPEGY
jgi:hypothetical protein